MRFHDLGPLVLEVDGAQFTSGGRRLDAVLATLLIRVDQRVPLETLLHAVWGPDASPSKVGTLESHVWRLRRLLEPHRGRGERPSVLVNDSAGYRLVVPHEAVDSWRFERLVPLVADRVATEPEQALHLADEALGLWRGRPLEGVQDLDWVAGVVSRFEQMHVRAQELRVDARLGTGDLHGALADLDDLVAAHPFRERLWGQRMLALHRSARTDDALATYRRLHELMRDELGHEPGQEVRELHGRILRQEPALLTGHPRVVESQRDPDTAGLPPVTRLVGRTADVRRLQALYQEHQLVTVVGPPGCGKTSLAVETARTLAHEHRDGVHFVDLGAVVTRKGVLSAVLQALGLSAMTSDRGHALLARVGRERRHLLVLDNCEHVLDACVEVLDHLLGPGTRTRVLATSREPLGVDAEALHLLRPLPVPAADDADEGALVRNPAVALFLGEWREADDETLDLGQLRVVARICHATDGLPLAIRLAAAMARTYHLGEVLDIVQADPSGLTRPGHGRTGRHRTVHNAIDASYRTLEASDALVHRRLAVLPGSFDRSVVEHLVEGSAVAAWEVAGILARLVRCSLLEAAPSTGTATRFVQLATVRAHAAHLLSQDEETLAADRRDAWVVGLLHARPRDGTAAAAAWMDEVGGSLETVRATIRRNLAGEHNEQRSRHRESGHGVAAAVHHLVVHWYYRGEVAEGVHWVRQARHMDHDRAEVALLLDLGLIILLNRQGRPEEVRALWPGLLRLLAGHVSATAPEDFVEALVGAASGLGQVGLVDEMAHLLGVAQAWTPGLTDDHLAVRLDAALLIHRTLTRAPADIETDATRVLAAAVDVANSAAAWLACSAGNAAALATGDGERGLFWARLQLRLQHSTGSRVVLAQAETLGIFLCWSGDHTAGVQAVAAAATQARVEGSTWPRQHATAAALGTARTVLGDERFERTWDVGATLALDDLLTF